MIKAIYDLAAPLCCRNLTERDFAGLGTTLAGQIRLLLANASNFEDQ